MLSLSSVTVEPSYWEGAIDIAGKRNGGAVKGLGYLEMTGYAPMRNAASALRAESVRWWSGRTFVAWNKAPITACSCS